jgi:hypothetical protein
MRRIFKVILIAAKETPREFFAPIIGAYRGIKREYRLLDALDKRKSRLGHASHD